MDANEIFSKNLKFYVIKSGRTQSQIAADLGVSKGTFSDWTAARSHPRMDRVQTIADYFGIQKSDLLEDGERGTDENAARFILELKKRPTLSELIGKAIKLSDADMELVIMFVERMGGRK